MSAATQPLLPGASPCPPTYAVLDLDHVAARACVCKQLIHSWRLLLLPAPAAAGATPAAAGRPLTACSSTTTTTTGGLVPC